MVTATILMLAAAFAERGKYLEDALGSYYILKHRYETQAPVLKKHN
ncbi:MAG: hypothetical protein WBR26_15245 [Candidatus Acidiferrum sp.]